MKNTFLSYNLLLVGVWISPLLHVYIFGLPAKAFVWIEVWALNWASPKRLYCSYSINSIPPNKYEKNYSLWYIQNSQPDHLIYNWRFTVQLVHHAYGYTHTHTHTHTHSHTHTRAHTHTHTQWSEDASHATAVYITASFLVGKMKSSLL